jgi:serine/threonine-protein kinase RsbW
MTKFFTHEAVNVPCTQDAISKVEEAFEKVVIGSKMSESKISEIRLSLYEGLTNAIKHGNKYNPRKKVQVDIWRSTETIRIFIRDQGTGFDYRQKFTRCPLQEKYLTQCGGRGLFLMNQLSNRLCYSNNGRKVKMYFDLVERSKESPQKNAEESAYIAHPAAQNSASIR